MIEKSAGNIVFGDGGLGKSSLGLLWALQIRAGVSVAGFLAVKGKPLFLDYEDTDQVLIRRIRAIAAAHPQLGEEELSYQECSEPIWTITPQLQRRILEEHFTCIILDSLLPATGGDAGAEATTKAFNAIRKLKTSQGANVDALIFAHVAKGQADAGQRQTVYGSVFSQNYFRNIWELKREQEIGSETCILGLFHHKANHGPKLDSIGLQVTQNRTNTLLKYEPFDLSQSAELQAALPLPNRIRNLLDSDGIPRSSQQIAEELGAKLGTVKTTLSNPRYKGIKWQMVGEGKETKWTTLKG
jgi:RecA-family ATPase